MEKTILQEFVFPSLDFNTEERLYYHSNSRVRYSFGEKKFILMKGGILIFDTYVNSFTTSVWKKNTMVSDLFLTLKLKGDFIVRVGIHTYNKGHMWIREEVVNTCHEEDITIYLGKLLELEDGILYCYILASKDGEFISGNFSTTTSVSNLVKLGIVITHYNRQEYVIPVVKRIKRDFLSDLRFKDLAKLVIVDNSNNLELDTDESIVIIRNANLGGTGGFMRGLLYIEEHGFTHCLFMDDDASTEIESLRRTIRFFEYLKVDRVALAGTLHIENQPGLIYEKGARFEGICKPLKHMVDVRNIFGVVDAEIIKKIPDYGGWWFFGFKIKDLKYYAFPFFVRGDDIFFSIINKFKIITMNGIYTIGDDFGEKELPLQLYLDTRYHIINSIFKGIPFYKILLVIYYLFFTRLFSYRYESAHAVTYGIKTALKGPSFFKDNIDMIKIREYFNTFVKYEKPRLIDIYDINPEFPDIKDENLIRKIFRVITLNGFLIPSVFLKERVMLQSKSFRAIFKQIFLYKKVLYMDSSYKGFILEHRKKDFFREIIVFSVNLLNFILLYSKLKKRYLESLNEISSKNFWKSIFEKYNR